MKFVDEAKSWAKAGDGGNGAVAWRREKCVPLGGPAGGDGGNGGDVIFMADANIHSLLDFRFKHRLMAKDGENGRNKNQFGTNGDDAIIKLPPGTQVFDSDTDELLADMTNIGKHVVICKGGSGGHGNSRFTNSVRQAPDFAKAGLPGEEHNLCLSLKIMADVALLGFPNAGKSTLLSIISAARPKIADYPFTTLTPQIGVVPINNSKSLVVADIPGLIEGASKGAGLGIRFLKHLERVRVLCHLVEFDHFAHGGLQKDALIKRYEAIRAELVNFSPELPLLPEVVVVSKIDSLGDDASNAAVKEFESYISKARKKLMKISSTTNNGISELVQELSNVVFS